MKYTLDIQQQPITTDLGYTHTCARIKHVCLRQTHPLTWDIYLTELHNKKNIQISKKVQNSSGWYEAHKPQT